MRATTLKASASALGGLVAYYAGLAADRERRDGLARGPIDYYLDPAEPAGRWRGRGCEAMGVGGEVKSEQLAALLAARHPRTGMRLGRGFGTKSARAFDATFSAPKSVSVLWALTPDPFIRAEASMRWWTSSSVTDGGSCASVIPISFRQSAGAGCSPTGAIASRCTGSTRCGGS